MAEWVLEFDRGGVWLPELDLWLDPHDPKTGEEKVFVSHAHSDHVAEHREVIATEATCRLMRARTGGKRLEQVLRFWEPRVFAGPGREYRLTLLPAGHILGSAMALVESAGRSLLYTGDFKLRRGLSAEECDPSPAQGVDLLIMETTYGRRQYQFPPAEEVIAGVIRFCRAALDNDEIPVLLGYSMGKSQEILTALAEANLPIMVHEAVYKLTRIYEEFGRSFPPYERYVPGSAQGKVLICPPGVAGSAVLRRQGPVRTAVLTGWAMDPNCRYRYQADAAFPLSDHADFRDLLELVRLVAPGRVCTLHGFAADFAQTLRELGYAAGALSEPEQLGLALGVGGERRRKVRPAWVPSLRAARGPGPVSEGETFMLFARTCEAIAGQSGKLEKVRLLADYLRGLSPAALGRVAVWFTGVPFASSENRVLRLGWALLRDAFCVVAGVSEEELRGVYLKHSDLGETAFEVFSVQVRAGTPLSIEEVDQLFHQLQLARGPSEKLPWLAEALRSCQALEAKFLVKIVTGDLRIGLKEGLVEESIAQAFEARGEAVRQANLLLGHIGETAQLARAGQLEQASLVPFRPVKFMLASPEATAADVWSRFEGKAAAGPVNQADSGEGTPAMSAPPFSAKADRLWLEDKYDGIRCQVHKVGSRAALYSRDLKDVTDSFPDLADPIRSIPGDFVVDGEILAVRGEEVLPFAELQRRLGRKGADFFLGTEMPVRLVAFDLLWLNGESCLVWPLRERRRALEGLLAGREAGASWGRIGYLARITEASSMEEIDAAFEAARARKNEGLMIKDPGSAYAPGRRGLAWLKLKKALATLDCVVVGAEYGHGKRKSVLSDYTFAVRDEESGELKTIGKAYSGLTDEEIVSLTEHFLGACIARRGRYHVVEPDTVLEIAFDRIQSSPRHSSGLALRFPRIVRIRPDKSPAEIDTLQTARRLAAPMSSDQ